MDPLRLQSSFALLLRPLALLYSLLTSLRRKSWENGLMTRLKPGCPCVSVGNIAWGGTGKTPVTGWIMDWAAAHHHKVVVLSRGYKADLSVVPVYVKPQHSAREVGDEPLMLALDHPGGIVLVDPNRRRSGHYALSTLAPSLLVLDDGFQHLPVRRDLDLVLMRPEDLSSEWNKVIPAGSWRENASALNRASAFLFKADHEEMQRLLPAIKARLQRFERPVFSFTLRPTKLEAVTPRVHCTEEELHELPYALLAGVGNPQQVRETVTRFLGHAPTVELFFPDHYAYTFRDADRISKPGLPVVCTRKDAVKLRHLPLENIWSLRVEAAFEQVLWSNLSFSQWFDAWWKQQSQPRIDLLGSASARWTGFAASRDSLWTPQARHPQAPPHPGQPHGQSHDQPTDQSHDQSHDQEDQSGAQAAGQSGDQPDPLSASQAERLENAEAGAQENSAQQTTSEQEETQGSAPGESQADAQELQPEDEAHPESTHGVDGEPLFTSDENVQSATPPAQPSSQLLAAFPDEESPLPPPPGPGSPGCPGPSNP